jgi:hypothetical protein
MHPAINAVNKKKLFAYKGPHLIIDNIYFENPKDLIKSATLQFA